MPVLIHNREYVTVSERVQEIHKNLDKVDIVTEIVRFDESGVLVKAIVSTPKGRFFGHSYTSFNSGGLIEKSSPIEVAETSAIGRALGFAGYGIVDGMATADEVKKSEDGLSKPTSPELYQCVKCKKAITEKVFKYSTEMLGESLCMDCQKNN